MQTRKRAKSATFGKKPKEKEEKEIKPVEEETAVHTSASSHEPVEAEEKKSEEKAEDIELSTTLPHDDTEEKGSHEVTPADDFVIDTSPSTATPTTETTPDEPKETEKEAKPEEVTTHELSQPIESAPTTTPEQKEVQEPELSPTPPASAFTIQSDEQPEQDAPSSNDGAVESPTEKKHFGLYFIVVAFLSFVLGLGAMAGASYFGLVNVNFSKLPAVPGLLGQKPTPTAVPPTAIPTQKPVDLTAFTIAVFNGSGISGKAADVKTSLTTAGFTVSTTGNADKSTYTKTEISAKKTVNHEFLTKLEDELNKTYDVDTTVATSPDSDKTDVTVTLGSNTSK